VREIRLGLTQSFALFFGALAFRHIHVRTDDFNKLSARTEDRMTYSMDVSNCSIG
jgi:hypothetical protein